MVTPQGVMMVLVGAIACFMGYSMFRSMLPLWGFILGGFILMTIVPNFISVPASQSLFLIIGTFVIGGLIGALISTPLYYVIVFLSGAALGAIIGILLGTLVDMGGITNFKDLRTIQNMNITFPPQVHTMTQLVLLVLFGGILGFMSLSFQKFMITASSAFVGAAALIGGLSAVITNSMPNVSGDVLLMIGWLLLGMVGIFVQFRVLDDEI